MGALIFLLLVTTRMIRDRASNLIPVAASTPPQLPLLNVKSPLPAVDVAPVPIEVPVEIPAEPAETEEPPAIPLADLRAVALEQRERELAALAARWQERVSNLNEIRDERARLRAQRRALQEAAARRIAEMQRELQELEIKLGNMTGELSAAATGNGTARERIELETQISELKRRIRAAQQTEAGDNSKFEVVPFDVVSGTSRRPILIECTATGIKFIPEDVVITKDDLVGFNPHVNPLLVGANALSNYWTAWNIRQPNPAGQPEPYVLLLVRPSGTVAYYVAMNMLRDLKQPFGYELISEETEIQPPEVNVGARAACEGAVSRLIAERDQVLRAAGLTAGGSGIGTRPMSRPGRSPVAGDSTIPGGPVRAGFPGGSATGAAGSEFDLADIVSRDDATGGNWERVENFEGSPRRNLPGGQVKEATGARFPANNRHGNGTGTGAGNSSGQLAVVAGGSAVGEEGVAPRQGTAAKPGMVPDTVPGTSGTDRRSGIESLDDSQPGQNSADGAQPGTDVRPDTGLGSSGKLQLPVEDQRGRKRKSTDRDTPTEPEQLAHRHWGISEPGATIGLEREVRIDIEPKRYVIGRKHAVAIEDTDSREDSFAKIVTVLDLQARDWGKPPQGFFWKPSLRFVIADGGDANYERVHSLLERAGLASTREYEVEYMAEHPEKSGPKVPATAPEPAPAKPKRGFFRGLLK